MSSLVGWIDSAPGDVPAAMLARRMVGANPLGRAERARAQGTAAAGLAVEARGEEGDIATVETLSAAIVGRPRWKLPHYAELARRQGHAATAIEAFRRHGERFLEQLGGWFSVALVDSERKYALLAIDRYGVHTMCWAEPKTGGLVFGSRTDCVRAHPAVTSSLSDQAVFDYLYFAVCPSPGTIYREHAKLLPAQYLVHENGQSRTGFYWQIPYRERTDRPIELLSRELMERLDAAVERSIGEADPAAVGAFLSGGLDSSTVAGLLSKSVGTQAKTFTIGFAEAKYDESPYAEIAARHFNTRHHRHCLVPKDVVNGIVPLATAFDEPFGNSSVVPAYYCARMARDAGVTRMLAGDGGDEIFAGNSRYVDQMVLDLYARVPQGLRVGIIEPIFANASGWSRLPLIRKMRNFVLRARLPMPDRMESHNFYAGAELGGIFTQQFLAVIDSRGPLDNLREAYDRTASSSMLQRMLHLDMKITLADNDLRKVGVACEFADMSVAFPFLDDDVVAFSAEIEPGLLVRRFERRWFFRQAVRSLLPPEILAKRKHGFGMPFSEWPHVDPELREIALDCLAGFGRRYYCREEFLRLFFAETRDPRLDGLVWDIMMLELWLRDREARDQKRFVA